MGTLDLRVVGKKAQATRKKILDVVVSLIKSTEYKKITIRKICQEANVSIGTFYKYFSSKNDVLLDIYIAGDQSVAKLKLTTNATLSSIEKLKQAIHGQMVYTLEVDKEVAKALYAAHMTEDNSFFLSEDRDFFIILNTLVLEGQKKKEIIDSIDSREITWDILRFSRGIIFHWLCGDNFNLIDLTMNRLNRFLTIYEK
jgi:AcrR family transcriptional regulator